MSVELVEVTGKIVTFKITGTLTQPEMAAAYEAASAIIEDIGRVSFLVLLEDFQGAEREGDWGDVSFQLFYDKFIDKIAIVGEKEWKEMTLLFTGKGIRRVRIEYFEPADLPKARAWLDAPVAEPAGAAKNNS